MSANENKKIETVGYRIKKLRRSRGDLQKDLALALNKSESAVRMWELGKSEPDIETLKLIAERYSVSVSYLVNDSAFCDQINNSVGILTSDEVRLVSAYRSHPEMKDAVDKLLGISKKGTVEIYIAAESNRKIPNRKELFDEERWNAIKNLPETDDDLM